jgi:hypothetical protein
MVLELDSKFKMSNLRIVYTEHFWDRFRRSQKEAPVPLTEELIESAILYPNFTMPDPKYPEREWRVKKISGRCLRIVVEPSEDKLIVITVLFDRNLRRKRLCDYNTAQMLTYL